MAPQSSNPSTGLDEFLLMVKKFSENPVFKNAEAFMDDHRQLATKIKSQEEMMIKTTNELVLTKKELERSNERWKTEYPEKIAEVLRIHREETQKILNDKNRLQTERDGLHTEIAAGKSRFQDLDEQIRDLTKQFDDAQKQTEALQDQVSILKKENAKHKAEISRVNDLLRTRDNLIKDQKVKILDQDKSSSAMQEKKTQMETQLRKQDTVIKRIQDLAPQLIADDVPSLTQSLKKYWQSCFQAVSRCFEADIAAKVLEDPQSWKPLKDKQVLPEDIPFPPSNASSAKRIRTMALMGVIASLLVQHIFTPTYLLFEDDEFRNISLHLATAEADRGRFLRRVLNGTSEDKQAAVKEERIESILKEVMHCIQPLLDEKTKASFHSSLSQVLTEMVELWSSIQRRTSYFEADVELDPGSEWKWLAVNWDERKNDLKEREIAPENLQALDAYIVLFPRVYIVTDSVDQPVFPGIILPRSETKAAREEWDKIRQSNPMLGRSSTGRSMRPRRLTLNRQNDAGKPFLGPKDL